MTFPARCQFEGEFGELTQLRGFVVSGAKAKHRVIGLGSIFGHAHCFSC